MHEDFTKCFMALIVLFQSICRVMRPVVCWIKHVMLELTDKLSKLKSKTRNHKEVKK